MADASTRHTRTTAPPGAALVVHGGLVRTVWPKRHWHSTAACCAHAAWCTPRLMRCNALLPKQFIIAAAQQPLTSPHHLCTLRSCTRRTNTSTLACKSPRDPLPTTWPRCSAACSATRSPQCSSLPVACCAAGLSSNPSCSACFQQASPCSNTTSALRSSTPAKRTPAGQPHHPGHHPHVALNGSRPLSTTSSASTRGTFEWTIPSGTATACDLTEYLTCRCALVVPYHLRASGPFAPSAACSLLITLNASHRVRHHTGRLKSPAERPR